MENPIGQMINHRYILHERLGAGGMGVVFLATDRLTGQQVALKQVVTSPRHLEFASKSESMDLRLALAQEFKMLASVRHPNIVSVLDYGFDAQHQPYFTMELLENSRMITEIGQAQPFANQVGLMAQLIQAMAYLHRRGIVHRDLKPGNVLVVASQADGVPRLEVKVLDFGLAIEQGHVLDKSVSGTIAYIAPEVLNGGSVTTATDIYALGVIAYELYAGEYPYPNENAVMLMINILEMNPDVESLDIDDANRIILKRMLAKDPADRFVDAYNLLVAYAERNGYPIDTSASRESYLQAARLVGRTEELAKLAAALGQVIRVSQGGIWLLAGESGIGKTRLLDEVAALAMVQGAQVLRGQAVSEGSVLYSVWRPILRHLCLFTSLEDDEANILKMLVPDIATLIDRELPDIAPIASPQLAREQLLATISAVFRRQHQPIVIILEDLHWASESLDVLEQLQEIAETTPLLIIGSYRDDERPDLPKILPGSQVLKLQRLDKSSVAELSAAMLGDAGKNPEVIDLLHHETEGNVFFIVEVMRALAEDAGQLEHIGSRTLPTQIFTGGVQRIIQRRLERVPEESRRLLALAAVAGRELNLPLLEMFTLRGALTDWLVVCQNAAVIEVQEGKWRFAHDKIREAVLVEIPSKIRQHYHHQIAEALERLYPDQPDYMAALAYHWKMAQVPEKIIHYSEIAGDQAIQSGVNREARAYFTDVLEALAAFPPDEAHQRKQIDLTLKLVRASSHTRDEQLMTRLHEATEAAKALGDTLREVRLKASEGAYYYTIGKIKESIDCFNEAIPRGEALADAGDVLMIPYSMLGRTLLFFGDYEKASELLAKGVQLAEQFNDIEILSGTMAVYASSLWDLGKVAEGQLYADRSIAMAETLSNPVRQAANYLWLMSGAFDCCLIKAAKQYSILMTEYAWKSKDNNLIYISSGHGAKLLLDEGKIEQASLKIKAALEMARTYNLSLGLPQYMAVGAVIQAYEHDREGAIEQINAAFETMAKLHQFFYIAELNNYAAHLYRRLGDYETAAQYVEKGLATARTLWQKVYARLENVKLALAKGEAQRAAELIIQYELEFTEMGVGWYGEQLRQLF